MRDQFSNTQAIRKPAVTSKGGIVAAQSSRAAQVGAEKAKTLNGYDGCESSTLVGRRNAACNEMRRRWQRRAPTSKEKP